MFLQKIITIIFVEMHFLSYVVVTLRDVVKIEIRPKFYQNCLGSFWYK